MRTFKNTWFARFAGKEGITDSELLEAVNQLEKGQAMPDNELANALNAGELIEI